MRIRHADLPQANSEAIYQRMQKEREREANEYRAEGDETAQRIRARAEREVTVLTAEATRESEILRGEGDAEKTRILGEAFGQDPDFFAFYRSMQAYQDALPAATPRWCCRRTAILPLLRQGPAAGSSAQRGRREHRGSAAAQPLQLDPRFTSPAPLRVRIRSRMLRRFRPSHA